jgi:uncharacterized membrane protein YeaQ/YmgE (transglycosylase-associated protein family)
MARAWLRLAEQADKNNETIVEQILINLITGALGGVGAGKASPTFDLGTIGNIISGLVGGGVLGQIVTLALPFGRSTVRQSEYWRYCLTSDRRWRWPRSDDHIQTFQISRRA